MARSAPGADDTERSDTPAVQQPDGGGACCTAAADPQHPPVRGYTKEKDALRKRLRRIEGQIRGLQRMVDEDVYCIDILTQISASTKALEAVALHLLEEHLHHCVHEALATGSPDADAKITEAAQAVRRLVRS